MEIVLLHSIVMFSLCSAIPSPTLDFGDVEVSEVTNNSALLSWRQDLASEYNITDNNLRLFVHVYVSDQALMYMNPAYNDSYCSLQLSQCHLRFLTPGTRYNVVLTIDGMPSTIDLLGEAKVTFVTEAIAQSTCSKGNKSKSWLLLSVALPISGGFNLLLMVLVCIFVYHWRKRQRKGQIVGDSAMNGNITATQENLYNSSDGSEHFYTPMNLNSSGNQWLAVPFGQSQATGETRATTAFSQPQSSRLYENEGVRPGDSTALYDNARLRDSRQNNFAQRQQIQQNNGSKKGHNIYVNECFPRPPPTS